MGRHHGVGRRLRELRAHVIAYADGQAYAAPIWRHTILQRQSERRTMPEVIRVPDHVAAYGDMNNTNWAINHGATYETDQAQYGVPEKWAYISPAGYGDCEDYALTKLRRLRALGWPLGSLDLAICTAADGSGHCVVVAHLVSGDYILDCNSDAVMPWKTVPYAWVMSTIGTDLLNWVQITA